MVCQNGGSEPGDPKKRIIINRLISWGATNSASECCRPNATTKHATRTEGCKLDGRTCILQTGKKRVLQRLGGTNVQIMIQLIFQFRQAVLDGRHLLQSTAENLSSWLGREVRRLCVRTAWISPRGELGRAVLKRVKGRLEDVFAQETWRAWRVWFHLVKLKVGRDRGHGSLWFWRVEECGPGHGRARIRQHWRLSAVVTDGTSSGGGGDGRQGSMVVMVVEVVVTLSEMMIARVVGGKVWQWSGRPLRVAVVIGADVTVSNMASARWAGPSLGRRIAMEQMRRLSWRQKMRGFRYR